MPVPAAVSASMSTSWPVAQQGPRNSTGTTSAPAFVDQLASLLTVGTGSPGAGPGLVTGSGADASASSGPAQPLPAPFTSLLGKPDPSATLVLGQPQAAGASLPASPELPPQTSTVSNPAELPRQPWTPGLVSPASNDAVANPAPATPPAPAVQQLAPKGTAGSVALAGSSAVEPRTADDQVPVLPMQLGGGGKTSAPAVAAPDPSSMPVARSPDQTGMQPEAAGSQAAAAGGPLGGSSPSPPAGTNRSPATQPRPSAAPTRAAMKAGPDQDEAQDAQAAPVPTPLPPEMLPPIPVPVAYDVQGPAPGFAGARAVLAEAGAVTPGAAQSMVGTTSISAESLSPAPPGKAGKSTKVEAQSADPIPSAAGSSSILAAQQVVAAAAPIASSEPVSSTASLLGGPSNVVVGLGSAGSASRSSVATDQPLQLGTATPMQAAPASSRAATLTQAAPASSGAATLTQAVPERSGVTAPTQAAPESSAAPVQQSPQAQPAPLSPARLAPQPARPSARSDAGPVQPKPAAIGAEVPNQAGPVEANPDPTQSATSVPMVAPTVATTPTSPTASASPPQPHTPTSPAAQAAPAMVSLFHAADGGQRMTLRLQPDDLGQVEIKIETPGSGPTRVEITVEKQETLNLMLHDQAQLQRALDQAGLPADGRSVTFHIAAPEPSVSAGTQPFFQGGSSGSSPGSDGQWASGGGGGSRNGGGQGGDPHTPDQNHRAARWLRAGLDITA